MTTMNISLPESLKAFVEKQVTGGGFGTGSEYIRSLIRKDQALEHLRTLLLEGAASPATEMEADYFDKLRARVVDHAAE